MQLEFKMIDLMVAGAPLVGVFMTAFWLIAKQMVFNPLHEISTEIKALREFLSDHDSRIAVLETKVDQSDK